MRALATALVISVISLTIHAQQSSSLLGKWSGTMSTAGGGEVAVELILSETAGTWRFVPRGRTRNNCLGKDFPVAVTAQSATEIKFEVRGSSVIPGCINSSVVIKAVDGNRLEGSLDDGSVVKLAR